ncbi:MAG: M48 family metallopeptidase [Phycisphaerales bacterium]|nr:MAG: M48 family metallopeptidase [Phycisphaerales bacterium]
MNTAKSAVLILLVASICWLAGCAEVGITGRRQLNFMPDSIINSMSLQQYSAFISENEVVTGAEQSAMVKRCGERIRKAVDEYCQQYCDEDPFEGYEWEFNLVQDDAVNAFAMPGGKVVVYTGLLPVAENEAGLAVVMGHEIAHVFADHGAERMSQSLLMQGGQIALSELLKEKPEETRNLFITSYGLGAQIGVMLPFSRLHENEADRLGLIFMAMAGYDPHVAVTFWQRMAAKSEGSSQPPEILSTHPVYDTRIQNIKDLMSEAMEYYKPVN